MRRPIIMGCSVWGWVWVCVCCTTGSIFTCCAVVVGVCRYAFFVSMLLIEVMVVWVCLDRRQTEELFKVHTNREFLTERG